jgi:hypothetical protein
LSQLAQSFARSAVGLLACTLLGLAGCAKNHAVIEPRPGPLTGLKPAEADARAEAVRRDPIAYLHKVAEKCAGLEQYTITFTRQERRGLFARMQKRERISCWFRREPFSIRMKWLDPDIKYGESTYVAGQAGGKVRFVPRHGLFGLEPRVTAIDVQTPVIWGEARYPVTDFGLDRMMQRTLRSLKAAGDAVTLSYEGLLQLPDSGRIVHHIHLEYTPSRHRAPIQEIYFDLETDLPAGTILKFPSGKIDAVYLYENINHAVALSDDDFLLEAERTRVDSPPTHASDTASP